VDANVGGLLAELESLGLLDRTLVVVASDHGESFYEHGSEGHGRNLYREVVATPLVLSLPFRLPGGAVVETPVENVDIWPTLLDLLGAPALPGAEGRSLVASIEAAGGEGRSEPTERLAFSQLDRTWGRVDRAPLPLVAVTRGRYRLMHRPDAPDAPELYDVDADPTEQRNIAAERPELSAELRGEAEAYLRRSAASFGRAREVQIDELQLGQLRALGYLDRPRPVPRDQKAASK
jgi:arylsulfatase A-like enzyme